LSRHQLKKTIKGIQVSNDEFLKAKPVRNLGLEWTEDEKGVHVKIPPKKTLLFKIFSKFLPLTRETRVLLDEQGSFIWNLCDGKNSIKTIAESLNKRYNMPISHAEAALDVYFIQLSKQGLVGFVLPESTRKRYKRQFRSSTEMEKEKRRA